MMGLGLLLFGLMGLWTGCTPEKRYKVLSFLFDGVPDPNAPVVRSAGSGDEASTTQPTAGNRGPVQSIHKPFADNQCSSCHKSDTTGGYEVSAVNPTICLDCHQTVTTQHPVMHAPVVSKACLWCHSPHDSPTTALLREPPPGVCTQCHDRDLLGPKPPEHLQPSVNCLECHVAHGSEKRNLLRKNVAILNPPASPTTQPAEGGRP